MAKVKIGDKEFEIKYLKFGVAKRLVKEQTEKKRDQLDYNSHILATAINACNPEAKLTGETFDNLVDVVEFERVQKEIMDFSGLDKFFKPVVGKKS